MSLCDSCYSPGACCKRMQLFNSEYPTGFTFWDDTPVAEQTKNWESFPFEATEKDETQIDPDSGRSFSTWFFSCPNLPIRRTVRRLREPPRHLPPV